MSMHQASLRLKASCISEGKEMCGNNVFYCLKYTSKHTWVLSCITRPFLSFSKKHDVWRDAERKQESKKDLKLKWRKQEKSESKNVKARQQERYETYCVAESCFSCALSHSLALSLCVCVCVCVCVRVCAYPFFLVSKRQDPGWTGSHRLTVWTYLNEGSGFGSLVESQIFNTLTQKITLLSISILYQCKLSYSLECLQVSHLPGMSNKGSLYSWDHISNATHCNQVTS